MAEAVETIVYEPFLYRLKGDHRGFYFDIDKTKLFCNVQQDPFEADLPGICSGDKKNAEIYIETLYMFLTENNVPARLEKLVDEEAVDHEMIETIDSLITQGCMNATAMELQEGL